MECFPVQFFLDLFILCNWLQKSVTAIVADDITYVIDGDLPSNNLRRWIAFIILVM